MLLDQDRGNHWPSEASAITTHCLSSENAVYFPCLALREVKGHRKTFVSDRNHERHYEAPDNLTSVDVFYGRRDERRGGTETARNDKTEYTSDKKSNALR